MLFTGKSFSEALILPSVNPEYDTRLFIEFPLEIQVQNKLCTKKFFVCLFVCFDIQNKICTQHVLNLYFSGDSMNNLLSYCGLTGSRMRASDTDLPVNIYLRLLRKQWHMYNIIWVSFTWKYLWEHRWLLCLQQI